MSSPRPLAPEQNAMRHILARLMEEEANLETLCKYAPRLVSVSANVARIQAALESANEPDETNALRTALRELATETTNEENDPW